MEWISVKDRLPELDTFILSTDGEIVATTIRQISDQDDEETWNYFTSGCGCCDSDMKNVTHWMPLPKPPRN